jgi:hypothetical protein
MFFKLALLGTALYLVAARPAPWIPYPTTVLGANLVCYYILFYEAIAIFTPVCHSAVNAVIT